jgi:hypothetical protein
LSVGQSRHDCKAMKVIMETIYRGGLLPLSSRLAPLERFETRGFHLIGSVSSMRGLFIVAGKPVLGKWSQVLL